MRKHNYVVGYKKDENCIYGNPKLDYRYTNPLTLYQAKQLSKKIRCCSEKSVIYKLVEVKTKKSNKE